MILAGFDEGAFVAVNPRALSRTDEIRELLEGRKTFALVAGELVHRHPGRIRFGLVGSAVYVEHRCHVQPPLIGAAT